MLTFKEFLAERRSSKISVDKAIAWMEEHAMDYLHGEKFLYRGVREADAEITFADTHVGEPRKSIGGMNNFYTWWMSYNPKWEGKPRRERSFITSSDAADARTWGLLHLFVPNNSAKIGAVGENDIWNIVLSDGTHSAFRLSRFASFTKRILDDFELHPTNYEELASSLKQVKYDMLVLPEGERGTKEYHIDKDMVNLMKERKKDNLFDLWADVFDPSNFEFMTPGNIKGDGEFWVDGQAIYIPLTFKLGKQESMQLMRWAEEKAPKVAEVLNDKWFDGEWNDGGYYDGKDEDV